MYIILLSSLLISPVILTESATNSPLTEAPATQRLAHCPAGAPKSNAAGTPGIKELAICPPTTTLSSTPSPKLILPVAVIVPAMLMLPVPVMLLPFRSKFADNCGDASVSNAPLTNIPPTSRVSLGLILPPT